MSEKGNKKKVSVYPETFEILEEKKRKYETWDSCLRRLAGEE